jgi:acetolactate synthase-1/2/3 large subunit
MVCDWTVSAFLRKGVWGPKAASRRLPDGTMVSEPLENMAPFLPEEEVGGWMNCVGQKLDAKEMGCR